VIGGAARRRSRDGEADLGSPQDGDQRIGAHQRILERSVRLGRLLTTGGGEHGHELNLGLGQDGDCGSSLLGRCKGIAFGPSRKPSMLRGHQALKGVPGQVRVSVLSGDTNPDLSRHAASVGVIILWADE
jgi:hypothetical protein